jgi:branched-chain amino acid transport system substrate-binding protein
MKKSALFISLLLLISLAATACGPQAAPFECTDEIGCVDIPPGDPIRIGYALVIAGPNESLGVDSRRGIEIAIDDMEGEFLGHPIELVGEDAMCSAEGRRPIPRRR